VAAALPGSGISQERAATPVTSRPHDALSPNELRGIGA
jgi:hypothetical protein